MRKTFLSAVSIAALLAGSAWAQSDATGQQAPTMPPASSAEQPAAQGGSDGTMTVQPAEPMEGAEGAGGDVAVTEPESDVEVESEQAATDPSMPAPSASAGTEVSAEDMIGREVYGDGDQEIGEVKDVILDPETKEIRRLVIGVGGFLGLGEKTVAVDFQDVEVRPEQGIFVAGMTSESVEQMEEFNPDENTVSLDQPAPAAPAAPATTGGTTAVPPPATGAASQ